MDLLIDTNVVLDLLLKRKRYAEAAELFRLIKHKGLDAYVIATSVTNAFYLIEKQKKDTETSYSLLLDIFRMAKIAEVSQTDLFNAYVLYWRDFEDALQMAVAYNCGMDSLITNNIKDFEEALVPVMTPEEFCASVGGR